MIRFSSPLVLRTALVVVSISTASCGSLANYVVTGHWEDPNAEEVSTAPKSAPKHAAPDEKKAEAANTAPEPALQAFPNETPFTYGIWTLYRNDRGMFFWTGKGDTLRLFAIELNKSDACWATRKADGPRVMHCLDKHYALMRDLAPKPGDKEETPSAIGDALNGLPNPPWRNNALIASNLEPANYDLPDRSGGKKGTFSLEATADKIKIQMPPIMGERWFVIPKDKTGVLFAGEPVPLFDGCTNADKTLAPLQGMAIQWDKKACGIQVDGNEYMVSLKTVDFTLEVESMDTPPDLAARQEDGRKLRKLAAEKKSQLDISVTGDATRTLVTARGKNPKGESFGLVESHQTIGSQHFRCTARLEGDAAAQLPRAKQICSSMHAAK